MSKQKSVGKSDSIKAFTKRFEDVARISGQSKWAAFEAFCATWALALSNALHKDEAREAEYMKIADHVGRETMTAYAELGAHVTMALTENPRQDFLGTALGALELTNKWAGQYFTPYSIAEMMARMSVGKVRPKYFRNPFRKIICICDPAVGAGCMLIAAVNVLRNNGVCVEQHVFMDGTDKDLTAFYMSYIQLTLLNIPAVVRWGNSLSAEQWQAWATPAYHLFNWHYKLQEAARRDALIEAVKTEIEIEDGK